VQAALDGMRAKLGEGERIDFAELLTLGAEIKARRMTDPSEEASRAREEIAEWIRTGDGPKVDVQAVDEVKRLGVVTSCGE